MNKFFVSLLVVFSAATACLAQSSNRPTLAQQMTVSPNGVNLQTGRFTSTETDFSIGDLTFSRTWGSPSSFVTGVRAFGVVAGGSRIFYGWNLPLYSGVRAKSAGAGTQYQVATGSADYTFGTLSGTSDYRPIGSTSAGAKLTMVSGNWQLIDRSGGRHYYAPHTALSQTGYSNSPNQLLMQSVKPDGTVLDYQYNGSAQLILVTSSRGYAIRIEYDGVGNITRACGFNRGQTFVNGSTSCTASTLSASYGYAGGDYLRSVTGPSGEVTTINYGSNPQYGPACITLANSSTCKISNEFLTNTPADVYANGYAASVVKQTNAAGAVWTYGYEAPPNSLDEQYFPGRPRISYSTMNGPDGGYTFTYDRGRLIEYVSPKEAISYRYETGLYETVSETQVFTFEFMESVPKLAYNQSGTKDYFLYNERGQLIIRSLWPVGSSAPTLTNGNPALSSDPELAACCISYGVLQIPAGSVAISQAFLASVKLADVWPIGCGSGDASAKLCESPVSTIDARGNQTDYTYDPAHGGVLTETGPAQPNNVRPQTRYTYIQKQARIKDESGATVATGLPVWLLASKSYCKTSAASGAGCAVAGDQVTTTYDYGPDTGFNNLLLRGMVDDSTGTALRTCYSYDWQGNRISETRPMAGLSACP